MNIIKHYTGILDEDSDAMHYYIKKDGTLSNVNKIAEELITNVNKTCIVNKEDYYNARIFDTLTLKESSQLIINILRGSLYPFNINDPLNYYDL